MLARIQSDEQTKAGWSDALGYSCKFLAFDQGSLLALAKKLEASPSERDHLGLTILFVFLLFICTIESGICDLCNHVHDVVGFANEL